MPERTRIGCGLAGGRWPQQLVHQRTLRDTVAMLGTVETMPGLPDNVTQAQQACSRVPLSQGLFSLKSREGNYMGTVSQQAFPFEFSLLRYLAALKRFCEDTCDDASW